MPSSFAAGDRGNSQVNRDGKVVIQINEVFSWETHETINHVREINVKLYFLDIYLRKKKKKKFISIRIEASDQKLGFNKRISAFVLKSAEKVRLDQLTCNFMLISYRRTAHERC